MEATGEQDLGTTCYCAGMGLQCADVVFILLVAGHLFPPWGAGLEVERFFRNQSGNCPPPPGGGGRLTLWVA